MIAGIMHSFPHKKFVKIQIIQLNCRMGFHWPPFNSIKHLHLHVIFPESGMSFIGRQVFRPGTFYFATVHTNFPLSKVVE